MTGLRQRERPADGVVDVADRARLLTVTAIVARSVCTPSQA
ncbi:hypothetical protein [Nocardia mikamii]